TLWSALTKNHLLLPGESDPCEIPVGAPLRGGAPLRQLDCFKRNKLFRVVGFAADDGVVGMAFYFEFNRVPFTILQFGRWIVTNDVALIDVRQNPRVDPLSLVRAFKKIGPTSR